MFATQALVFSGLAWDGATPVRPSGAVELPVWLALTAMLTVVCTLAAYGIMKRGSRNFRDGSGAHLLRGTDFRFGDGVVSARDFFALGGNRLPQRNRTWTLLVGGGLITLANVLIQLKPPIAN